MWIRKLVLVSMVLALLHGCVNLNANPAEQLLGKWQVDIAGVELIVKYTQTTVQVGDSAPVPYALTGNQLKSILLLVLRGDNSRFVGLSLSEK